MNKFKVWHAIFILCLIYNIVLSIIIFMQPEQAKQFFEYYAANVAFAVAMFLSCEIND